MKRRLFLQLPLASLLSSLALASETEPPVRIGITPVFLSDQTSLLRVWQAYLEKRLQRPVRFIQRDSYREVTDGLLAGRLEFAWICGYPYIAHQARLRLVAIPLYQGAPLYHSYLIAAAAEENIRELADLRGRLFAYADPDSNSGYLVPRYRLQRLGHDPSAFFKKTFFTGGHRNAIEAVSVGLADGAHVDGYVWETLAKLDSALTRRTRVLERAGPFCFPPIVAGPAAGARIHERLAEVLFQMSDDGAAGGVLGRLNLDGFAPGTPADYAEIEAMARAAGEAPGVS